MEFKSTLLAFFRFLLTILLCSSVNGFDEAEMDVFDLVEEVHAADTTFYKYMHVEQNATTSDLKRSYRKLSLQLHPDRNSAENAETQFRWLVGINDVLRDETKRQLYDKVLVEGLPDWKTPAFYFRRMRKLGFGECVFYIVLLGTICQYFVLCAAHWERQYTHKQTVENQLKKKLMKQIKQSQSGARKSAKAVEAEVESALIEQRREALGDAPTVYDILPFQCYALCKFTVCWVVSLPNQLHQFYFTKKEGWSAAKLKKYDEDNFGGKRGRKQFVKQSRRNRVDNNNDIDVSKKLEESDNYLQKVPDSNKKESCSDEEDFEHVSGDSSSMDNDGEDSFMEGVDNSADNYVLPDSHSKLKTKQCDDAVWSQVQQFQLEENIKKSGVPPHLLATSPLSDWEKIGHKIEGKSGSDCLSRYKSLATIIKKQKMTK